MFVVVKMFECVDIEIDVVGFCVVWDVMIDMY